MKTMEQVRAFAPGNISCVFKVVPHPDPARMHSLGMGFTVREGVRVALRRRAETLVRFNGERLEFPTVVRVVSILSEASVEVEIESPLPLGAGFGLSGASALATAYALDALLGLGRSEEELALCAHVAEVENLTGLGDVCAQYHGGCLTKLRPGHPLAAESLPVAEQPVYYRYFGPIRTNEVLGSREQRERINRAAEGVLERIEKLLRQREVDFHACIRLAKQFALDSGLLRDEQVRRAIEEVETKGGFASMIMLGNAVFSTRPFSGALQTRLARQRARVLR